MNNDIIAGNDFISLFMGTSHMQDIQKPTVYRPYNEFNDRDKTEILMNASKEGKEGEEVLVNENSQDRILPLEAMFTAASSNPASIIRNKQVTKSSFRKYNDDYFAPTSFSDDTTVNYDADDITTEEPLPAEFPFNKIITISMTSSQHHQNSENGYYKMSVQNQKDVADSINSESTNSQVIMTYDNINPNAMKVIDPGAYVSLRKQQHDLLFSSSSATVTSNGPSGPFKAIICHDCEKVENDDEHSNVPHSVSFSAIKNWNVGSSKSNGSHIQNENQNSDSLQNDQDETNPQDVPKITAQKTKIETDEPEEYVYKLEPAKNYGEPSKNYGEPSKVYSEPAKNYGVPSKVYSEPSKIYSEPAKVYSSDPEPIQQQEIPQTHPEMNYEVEESVSVMSNGRVHGIQTTTPKTTTVVPKHNEHDTNDNNNNNPETPINSQDAKFGYVVEGINYRKYRVEEKTPDGFIVGEYGVVNNNDGSPIRGVRYTADSNINPRLIYDALLKFLSL
ncbi:unnamed protein product [Diamesa hyperborea]